MLSKCSQEELGQLLRAILSEELSDTAKLFFQSKYGETGIYLVISGKVRLLDGANNLISTLGMGSSFGEMTLFPEAEFSYYAARASTNLKLCYLNKAVLQTLMSKYPKIRDRLFLRAEACNLF